jgi:hypothetical protein
LSQKPNPPKKIRLNSLPALLAEARRVYRAGVNGQIPWPHVNAAARMLRLLLELTDLVQLQNEMQAFRREVIVAAERRQRLLSDARDDRSELQQ